MKKINLVIISCFIAFSMVINTGCWNYREIENFAIVFGVAIDKNPITNDYILTVQILSAESPSSKNNAENFSQEGSTIFYTVRRLVQIIGKKLYWSHTKVLILINQIAQEGVIPAIDWFTRDSEPRPNMWVLVSREKTASEILANKSNEGLLTADILNKTIENQKISNRFISSKLWQFVNDMSSKDTDTLATGISMYKGEEAKSHPIIENAAIFKKDKLVGWIVGSDNLYRELITNNSNVGIIRMMNVNNSDTNTTVEFFDNKTTIEPIYKNGGFTFNISLKPVVAIDEISGTENILEAEALKKLKQQIDSYFEQRITNFILKLQKNYDADIFKFKRIAMIKRPKIWRSVGASDPDIFKKFNFSVKVDVTIKGSGRTSTSIKPQE